MDKRLSGLLILALGAVGAYYLWPKAASAAEKKPEPKLPAGGAPDTTAVPPPAGGTASGTFTDPGTGATLVGPSDPIPPTTTVYTIKRGESWSNVASRFFGDYRWWPALWFANRANPKYANPDVINPGDQIQLDVRIPQTADKAQVFSMASADLAWRKRGKRDKAGKKTQNPLMSM